jgi:hypothetical protein
MRDLRRHVQRREYNALGRSACSCIRLMHDAAWIRSQLTVASRPRLDPYLRRSQRAAKLRA